MGFQDDKKPPVFSPRLGEDELGRILNLKERQEQKSQIAAFASRYLKLAWDLTAVDTSQAEELPVDFRQSPEQWSQQLADFEAQGLPPGLGVRTGAPSHLIVVEITAGEDESVLDHLGDWRAECVAQGSDNLERHFYALPPGTRLPTASILHNALITVYGEGSWVLVPPSSEAPGEHPWRWLTPPWASPPQYPQPALWQFLKKHISRVADSPTAAPPEIPSWEEIYGLVSPHAALLQALLAPADSPEEYYENLLEATLEVGFKDPPLLLGLLWHAPHGDARNRPDRWEYLVELVTAGFYDHSQTGTPIQPQDELAAISGERVVIERYRYEAMLADLRKLSARAAELERQLVKWGKSFAPESVPADAQETAGVDQFVDHPLGFLHGWSDLERQVAELVDNFLPDAELPEDQQQSFLESFSAYQGGSLEDFSDALKKKAKQSQQEDEVETAILECLEENPDLAEDVRKVEMLHYCLKNYVNFHPDLMGLPLRERVAEAGRMARDFLGEPLRPPPGTPTS